MSDRGLTPPVLSQSRLSWAYPMSDRGTLFLLCCPSPACRGHNRCLPVYDSLSAAREDTRAAEDGRRITPTRRRRFSRAYSRRTPADPSELPCAVPFRRGLSVNTAYEAAAIWGRLNVNRKLSITALLYLFKVSCCGILASKV